MQTPKQTLSRRVRNAAIVMTTVGLAVALVAHSPRLLHATAEPGSSAAPGTPGASSPATAVRNASPSAASTALENLSDAFASIAAQVKPSVVYITTVATERSRVASRGEDDQEGPGMQLLPQLPPEMQRFFQYRQSPMPDRKLEASGSGFVISADGYILTNNHVVDGATNVKVHLLDRREFPARVVGRDPNTDVAVLKIDAHDLVPAHLGDSDASRVGEWVLAVGNPLGENLTFTVTQGIISAKGRVLDLPGRSQRSIQDFIQTDAAINPGNSGGPLVNIRGDVIGINSAIASPTGTYAGYGFAVPINLANQVAQQIIKNGRVERAALGIMVRDADQNDAAYVGLPHTRGVVVQDVNAGSPAREAGLKAGDVIIAVDGQDVDYVGQLQERVAFRTPGEKVALTVARKGGERETIHVATQRTDSDAKRADATSDESDGASSARGTTLGPIGVTVEPVDGADARELQLPSGMRGLLVTGVTDDGPSAGRLVDPESGGPDVITSVEGTRVTTPAELRDALAHVHAGDIVTLRVYNAPAKASRVVRVRIGS